MDFFIQMLVEFYATPLLLVLGPGIPVSALVGFHKLQSSSMHTLAEACKDMVHVGLSLHGHR